MKRLLTLVALAFAAATSFGATLNPIQLLNPAGSTSGQAIVSTGPTTAPAWGGPFASSTGTTFTGATGVSYASPVFFVNDSTGAGLASMFLRNSGSNAWNLYSASTSSNQFALGRYVAGSFVDNPITISNSTGLVTMGDGLLGAAATFTTLSTTANDALFYQNSTSQSFASGTAATVTTWTKVADKVNANFNASTGVFTAPATGFYQVSAQLFWTSAANVSGSGVGTYIVANGVTVAQGSYIETSTATAQTICAVSAVVSLAAGQTIVLQGFQNSGVARTLGAVGTLSFMSITRIP